MIPAVVTGRARDKPIEIHNEEKAGDDDAEDETTPRHDLGRNAQRKKRREEKRSDPRNVPSISKKTPAKEKSDNDHMDSVLSELSSVRDGINDDTQIRKAELKMRLIEKLNKAEEEKQNMYQQIYDDLNKT